MESQEKRRDNLIRIEDRIKKSATIPNNNVGTITTSIQQQPVSEQLASRSDQDNLRAKNDLLAIINRNSAELSCDLELLVTREKRLRDLTEQYKQLIIKLQETTPENQGLMFGRSVDLIRIELYRLQGIAQALKPQPTTIDPASTTDESQNSSKAIRNAAWIVAISIICAAIAVAVSLFGVFKI